MTMKLNLTDAEIEAAEHLLGHYRYEGGMQGGSFTMGLIELLEKADLTNRAKLLEAFPEFRPAVTIMSTMGGDELIRWVKQAKELRREQAED